MIDSNLTKMRRSTAAKISRLSAERAKDYLRRIRETGGTIDQPAIRELTGGKASQSINGWVTRKLAARAGIIPKACA